MNQSERAQIYKNIFLNNPDGQLILEDLSGRFMDRDVFVRGEGGARETDFNLGARHAVRYILRQINQIIEVKEDGSSDPSNDNA